MSGIPCPECGNLMAPEDRFCSNCGAERRDAGVPGQKRRDMRVSREEMFAHLRSGETRPATILMADVTGFSALAANADPEWVFNLINQVLAELVECLVGHGAHIDNYVGDEVVALFGVPMAQERSAERALLAALSMQDRMKVLNEERHFGDIHLQIHTGINVGRVMVGPVGHGVHTDYTVIGDSVNVAKRLEDHAPPGEIYVSADVREAVGDGFSFEEIGNLTLPGIGRQVETFRVVGADQALLSQRATQYDREGFTPRRRELARLCEHAETVSESSSEMVSIVGPPGIGKSRFISDWRRSASAARFRSISTTCHACGAYFPLLPLADICARLTGVQLRGWPPLLVGDPAGVLDDMLISSEARERILQLLELVEAAPEEDLQELPQRLALALSELFASIAQDGPLCVIVEDVEWLDDASEAVLVELTDALPGGVLIILSARDPAPGWLGDVGIPRITVHRLPRSAMRRLVHEWTQPDRLPRTTVQAICNRADGHPHFARELVRSLRNTPRADSDDEVVLPESLQELFLSQLDRLDLPVRRVVQAASIVGEPLSLDILPVVLEDAGITDDAIRQTKENGLLSPGDAPDQFVYGRRLLFEVAYTTIPPRQRRRLHQRAADYLLRRMEEEQQALVHTAAHHAYMGYGDQRSIDLLLQSARVYKAKYSLREAIAAALRAIEVIASLRGEGDYQHQRVEALLLLSQCHEIRGEVDDAEASIAEAEILADECGDDELAAKVLTTSGTLSMMLGELDAAEDRYARALAIWQTLDNPTRTAHMAVGMGMCADQRGDRERALELFNQAAETAGAKDWVRAAAENNIGVIFLADGRYAEAEPHLIRGLDANQRDGDRRGVAQSRCSLGELYYRLGRLEDARRALQEAIAVAGQIEDTPCLALAQAWLHRLSYLSGEVPDADIPDSTGARLPPEADEALRLARADRIFSRGGEPEIRALLVQMLDRDAAAGNSRLELLALGLESALLRDDHEMVQQLSDAVGRAAKSATDIRLIGWAHRLLDLAAGLPLENLSAETDTHTCFDLRAQRLAESLRSVDESR